MNVDIKKTSSHANESTIEVVNTYRVTVDIKKTPSHANKSAVKGAELLEVGAVLDVSVTVGNTVYRTDKP